jgi:hypothetical protein
MLKFPHREILLRSGTIEVVQAQITAVQRSTRSRSDNAADPLSAFNPKTDHKAATIKKIKRLRNWMTLAMFP